MSQQAVIDEVLRRVDLNIGPGGGQLPPDFEVARWLEAANGNTDKAVSLLTTSLQWRQDQKIDDLLDWNPPKGLAQMYPIDFVGLDVTGCPVWLVRIGQCDIAGILSTFSEDVFVKYTIRILELSQRVTRLLHAAKQREKKSGNDSILNLNGTHGKGEQQDQWLPIPQQVVLFDLEGLAWKQVCDSRVLSAVSLLASLYERHYPETLRRCVVMNARPKWIFQFILKALSAWIDKRTLRKIQLMEQSNMSQFHDWLPVSISIRDLPGSGNSSAREDLKSRKERNQSNTMDDRNRQDKVEQNIQTNLHPQATRVEHSKNGEVEPVKTSELSEGTEDPDFRGKTEDLLRFVLESMDAEASQKN